MPTTEKIGEFVIMKGLEFRRMSCVTEEYVTRTRNVSVTQYVSINSALDRTLGPQGWSVRQKIFITGAQSLNEQDLQENLDMYILLSLSLSPHILIYGPRFSPPARGDYGTDDSSI